MNVFLTPEMEAWVRAKVADGAFESESDAVRQALRLLMAVESVSEPQLPTFETADDLKRMVDAGKNSPLGGEMNIPKILEEVQRRRILRELKHGWIPTSQ